MQCLYSQRRLSCILYCLHYQVVYFVHQCESSHLHLLYPFSHFNSPGFPCEWVCELQHILHGSQYLQLHTAPGKWNSCLNKYSTHITLPFFGIQLCQSFVLYLLHSWLSYKLHTTAFFPKCIKLEQHCSLPNVLLRFIIVQNIMKIKI